MRFYNKWYLEFKWWLIENKQDVFVIISLGIMLGITVLSYIYFNE